MKLVLSNYVSFARRKGFWCVVAGSPQCMQQCGGFVIPGSRNPRVTLMQVGAKQQTWVSILGWVNDTSILLIHIEFFVGALLWRSVSGSGNRFLLWKSSGECIHVWW